jgi:hypothetical protein
VVEVVGVEVGVVGVEVGVVGVVISIVLDQLQPSSLPKVQVRLHENVLQTLLIHI